MKLTLGELAKHIGAELKGDESIVITGVQTLLRAQVGEVSFLANPTYSIQLADTEASAVILSQASAKDAPCAVLIMENPYLGFALATQLFDNRTKPSGKIHASASIADNVKIGKNVTIGANAVIGEYCQIGDHSEIGAGSVIGDHSILGESCILRANVTLYHDVILGNNVQIHSGAVIGADGFGFAPSNGQWHKIAQLGGVRIGDNVEIGANTCIDRGALGNTVIENNVILDNLIQIGHNAQIGEGTAMAGSSGVAGSTIIGKHCIIGGQAGIAGHLNIADGVHITGMSMVTHSINESGIFSSGIPQLPSKEWRKNAVRFKQLDSIARRLKKLESNSKGTNN